MPTITKPSETVKETTKKGKGIPNRNPRPNEKVKPKA
jgi:hypothetical protein